MTEAFVDLLRCTGCGAPVGVRIDPLNEPDSIMVTCRCGTINVWRPR